MDDATIGAKVTLNTKPYDDGIVHIDKTTRAVLGKLSGLAVSMFGLGAIKNFVEDAVKAYIVQEDAVNGLERALKRVGEGSYSKQLQQVARDLQKLTIYGDEATLKVMALGVNMGISANQMEDATRAAMGLAAGYKLDLNTAMQLVGKAAVGNTALLGRYGIKLDQTKPKQEQFNELLKKGNDLFQLAGAQTFGQHLKQLQNAWGDLTEQVGAFVISLSGFDESMDGLKNKIVDVTDLLRDNVDQWAFEIKYVLSYFEAGLKNVYAMVEPLFSYTVQVVTDAVQNIVAIGQWAFDNADKLWENLPDILLGVLDDIINYFKNWSKFYLDIVVNLAKAIGTVISDTVKGIWDKLKKTAEMIVNVGGNLAKAIKGVFTGEGIGGFKEMWESVKNDFDSVVSGGFDINTSGFKKTWEDMKTDAIKIVAEIGDETQTVLNNAGVSAFPELQSNASIAEVVKKYANISDKFAEIDRERQEREADLEQNLLDRLNKKREQTENGTKIDPTDVAGQKNNVVGSFSAAILNGMFGANSPERETAKNTKKLVDLQRDLNDNFDEAFTYG